MLQLFDLIETYKIGWNHSPYKMEWNLRWVSYLEMPCRHLCLYYQKYHYKHFQESERCFVCLCLE